MQHWIELNKDRGPTHTFIHVLSWAKIKQNWKLRNWSDVRHGRDWTSSNWMSVSNNNFAQKRYHFSLLRPLLENERSNDLRFISDIMHGIIYAIAIWCNDILYWRGTPITVIGKPKLQKSIKTKQNFPPKQPTPFMVYAQTLWTKIALGTLEGVGNTLFIKVKMQSKLVHSDYRNARGT